MPQDPPRELRRTLMLGALDLQLNLPKTGLTSQVLRHTNLWTDLKLGHDLGSLPKVAPSYPAMYCTSTPGIRLRW
ncbi:hypothetical protein CONPUDRAFT_85698 [Coniophora puteana RWD-64-598 SS2]|uniref:Uncharacterized protein n=1 Tax=Coniophora puteana (strain RWD-64-598) TaxID=741705 RepID=A0A5M3M8A4_CONPW|nr:uncharacterized protein CONPUDRAFT_85698 [Coniophora puteana RWD-64-598 SS2]EIW75030.1 hypothetical protein CONPUDRAFT_85698 [Coniophora puteana RWD-64-598 SS2]